MVMQHQTATVPLTAQVSTVPPRDPAQRRQFWRESFDHGRIGVAGIGDFARFEGAEPTCAFCRRLRRIVWQEPRKPDQEGHYRAARAGEDVPDDCTPVVERWGSEHIAFRPLHPVTPLHTLVVPSVHIPDHTYGIALAETMFRAAELARSFEHAGYATNIISSAGRPATQSVMHLHVHVIPRRDGDALMVPWGTTNRQDPTAPHDCTVAQRGRDLVAEMRRQMRALAQRAGEPVDLDAIEREAAAVVDGRIAALEAENARLRERTTP